MKNKTKLQKIKEPAARIKVPAEWLYCSEKEVDAKMIAQACEDAGFRDVEYWIEAGVAEIPIGEKASMDMELVECDLEDEYGNEFLAQNKVITLYMVTLVPTCFETAERAMRGIMAACGGFFCGDTEDFTPIVK